jgi:hypothetical protein
MNKKNKNGQIDAPIITFAILVVGLIFFAPLALKIFNSIDSGLTPALGNVSAGAAGQTAFHSVMTTVTTFWDKVIIAFFLFAVVMLLISSFMIDTHPVFVILYLLVCFGTIIFIPNILQAADNIYSDQINFHQEIASLTYVGFLKENFAVILLGIMIISGIIIYGKISLAPSNSGGGR